MPEQRYCDCRMRFELMDWKDLKKGDRIYYLIDSERSNPYARGPMTVIDPAIGKLENWNGMQLSIPQVQPLKLVEAGELICVTTMTLFADLLDAVGRMAMTSDRLGLDGKWVRVSAVPYHDAVDRAASIRFRRQEGIS